MNSDRLNVALIGLGAWGTRAHLPSTLACDDLHVVALVDANQDTVQQIGEQFEIPGQYTSLDEMIAAEPKLDAVIIATPDDTHYDIVMAAFEQGLHVLCEKPLAYDVAQAEEMATAADRQKVVAKMGFIFRYSPVMQRMKELIDNGYIGQVQMFESVSVNAQFIDPQAPRHWKMTTEHANGGVFVEYGVHSIDLALWVGGPITNVVAHGVTLVRERPDHNGQRVAVDVDDACSWLATFARGGQALFRTGWATLPVGGGGTRVYGDKGSLAWEMDAATRRSERLVGVTLHRREPEILYEFAPPYDARTDAGVFPLGILARYDKRLISAFAQDIQAGTVHSGSFQDGLAAQRVLSAIRTSLDEKRWVDVIQ